MKRSEHYRIMQRRSPPRLMAIGVESLGENPPTKRVLQPKIQTPAESLYSPLFWNQSLHFLRWITLSQKNHEQQLKKSTIERIILISMSKPTPILHSE